MLTKISRLFFSEINRDTSIVLASTLANAIIGGLFFIIAPRILGPEQYGLFAVVASTGILFANLANFGIDTGILRFLNSDNSQINKRILKLAFQGYLLIGFLVFALGFVFAKPIANFLGYSNLEGILKIAFLGVILILITNFFIAALQAQRKFFQASLVNISANLVRLALIALGGYFFTINLYFLTTLFFSVNIISVIVGKVFVPLNFLKVENEQAEFKRFFSFNFWIAAGLTISSLPIDNYLLVKLAGPVAAGIYFAPFKVLSIVDQFAGNFSRVLASRFTSFDNHLETKAFIKNITPVVIASGVCFVVLALLAQPVVSILFGQRFLSSATAFTLIAIASVFTFATALPVSLIIYYFKKPKLSFLITVITIAFWIISNYLLIPGFQATGAAISYLLTEILAFLLFAILAIYEFSQKP